MVAVRRSSGSGTLVALVIFIVLTLVAGGAAIWLAQQASAAKKALEDNQAAFQERVAAYFTEHNWELATEEDRGPYGIQYGPSSYDSVKSYLEKATTYEQMTQVLGWDSVEGIKEAIRTSALQQEEETKFVTLNALLGAYEDSLLAQRRLAEQLQDDLDSLRSQIADKDRAFSQMQKKLQDQNAADARKYAQDLADWKEKYDKVVAAHTEQRKQTQEWKEKYEAAVADAAGKIAELQKEVQVWKQLLEAYRAGEEKPETLVAEGKVLDVEREYNIVVIEGGQDVQRQPNERLVVYSESPSGTRLKKGEIVVTKVHDLTASASVVKEVHRIDSGDLFVNLETWNQFQKPETAPAE